MARLKVVFTDHISNPPFPLPPVLSCLQNQNESSLSQGVQNNGFSKSESDLSHLGSQVAIETKTSPQAEPETTDPEELRYTAPEDTRESLISNSKGEFSFSSQLFEQDTRPSTAEFSEETTGACASGGESLTAGASMSQDAEPSTSTEEVGASSRGERFWKRIQEIAAQRRRSRLEHNRVLSTEGGKWHKTGSLVASYEGILKWRK